MNIYGKISAVMKDIEYLSKDDHVKFGQQDYKAISEEKVTKAVRESLIKHGVVIIPVEQEHSREGTISAVNTKYRIQNIDDIEDYVIAVSSGTGADTQDKGVGKAMTYSYKYLLLRTFAIPTGEDPDKISSAELDEKQKKLKEQQKKEKPVADDLAMIESFAETTNTDLAKIMAHYNVEKLNDLTRKQADEVIATLEKKMQANPHNIK